jgi:2-iminobutanoate/2-iminopropanoate deaminase
MKKEIIKTGKLEGPVDFPYSNAIRAGDFVFLAGLTALPELGDIKSQVRSTLEKIKSALEASGTRLANVIQVRVFLSSMEDFDAMNEVYKEYFPRDYPVRTTVQVGLIDGCLVEIDAVAITSS